jgi:hypothetical protein
LLGTESDVKPIEDMEMDTLLAFMSNATAMDSIGALDLPKGNMPPDIQGEYIFCPIELCADNGYGVPKNDTIFFRFGGDQDSIFVTEDVQLHSGDSLFIGNDTLVLHADTTIQITNVEYYYPEGQHNMTVSCDFKGDVLEKGGVYETKHQSEVYIMGSGNDFTAYFTIDYDCESSGESFKLKRGYIITGKVASSGIEHAVIACVNISVESGSDQGLATIPEKDWIFVYRVKNANNKYGTAERHQWYQN